MGAQNTKETTGFMTDPGIFPVLIRSGGGSPEARPVFLLRLGASFFLRLVTVLLHGGRSAAQSCTRRDQAILQHLGGAGWPRGRPSRVGVLGAPDGRG